jgi:hypothetical protein
MARQGKFGRSGTTQNLSMLVYQLLKEQMQTELQNILTAYQTNMKAGQYKSQFNGQNVDGQYVLNYYQSMLAGFPSGSTEYETLRSQLSAFEQQHKTDVQNLVIESMNNGTKVDFGLLGNGFPNRGIDDVTLSDIREWGASTIAELTANGDVAQADKIAGVIYIAGFNVERDGKEAALAREEITYKQFADWVGGQMKVALASGLTKDSEPYRNLMTLYSKSLKEAVKDGQVKAAEKYDKELRGAMTEVNAAAKAILSAYDGPFTSEIGNLWNQVDMNSLTPHYDLIKMLGNMKGEEKGGALYESLMNSVGAGNLDELFAEAVTDANTSVNALIQAGFSEADAATANKLTIMANGFTGSSLEFLSKSGVQFTSGNAANVMSTMEKDLIASGVSFSGNAGSLEARGGHPDMVMASLEKLTGILGKEGAKTYPWLSDISQQRVDVDYLTNSGLAEANTNGDGYVSAEEFSTFFASGKWSTSQISDAQAVVIGNMATEDIPNSRINPATLMNTFIEATYSQAALKAGSIMIVDERGFTSVSDWGDAQAGERELLPALVTINGKTATVYVKPISIKQENEGNFSDMNDGMTNGLNVQLYRLPGNYSSTPGGQVNGYVIITGMMNGVGGSSQQSLKMTIDQFERYTRSVFGAEFDFTRFNDPQQEGGADAFVSFTGSMSTLPEAWKNINNPNSEYYVGRVPLNADEPKGPPAIPEWQVGGGQFRGLLSEDKDFDTWLSNGLKDPAALLASATELSKRRGKTEVDTKDVIDALLKGNGLVDNLSYNTVVGKIKSDPIWTTALARDFGNIKAVSLSPVAPSGGDSEKWKSMSPGGPATLPPEAMASPTAPRVKSESEQRAEDKYRNMIPGLLPNTTPPPAANGTSFLDNAFRKNPDMVKPNAPKIGAAAPPVKDYSKPQYSKNTGLKVNPNPYKARGA